MSEDQGTVRTTRAPNLSPSGPLTCWALSDGRRGMENQVLGLAEALARQRPMRIETKRVALKAPYRWLPYPLLGRNAFDPERILEAASDPIAPPWPDLLIACGRLTIPLSIAVRRLSKGRTFTVQTQNPQVPLNRFDLVLPPRHDGLSGPNVLGLTGAPNRVSKARLDEGRAAFADLLAPLPRPLAAVLIGGDSKSYRLDAAHLERLVSGLGSLLDQGFGLAITTSRRTGSANEAHLKAALEPRGAYLWNGEGENPYFGLLAHADHILVTADSTNMLTEAAATGKPVHILPMAGGSQKFERLHTELVGRGIARIFQGQLETWQYAPLRETDRAAEAIDQALIDRASMRDGGVS